MSPNHINGHPPQVRHTNHDWLYWMLDTAGLFRLVNRLTSRSFRILTYHGLYTPGQASTPCIPTCFVNTLHFEQQMRIVARRFHPIRLTDALSILAAGEHLPPRSIAITFDDGYDCTFTLGAPILEKYRIPATVYVPTSVVNNDDLFAFDKLLLLNYWASKGRISLTVPSNKSLPVHCQWCWLSRTWPEFQHLVTPEQAAVLKVAGWDTIRESTSFGIDIGAHTALHTILGNERESIRRHEIEESVRMIQHRLGPAKITFSYPNGQPGDFSPADQEIVAQAGCIGAVCASRGLNGRGSNLFALKRFGIGDAHRGPAFEAELSGFRALVLRFIRRQSFRQANLTDACPFSYTWGAHNPLPTSLSDPQDGFPQIPGTARH